MRGNRFLGRNHGWGDSCACCRGGVGRRFWGGWWDRIRRHRRDWIGWFGCRLGGCQSPELQPVQPRYPTVQNTFHDQRVAAAQGGDLLIEFLRELHLHLGVGRREMPVNRLPIGMGRQSG
ncbi:MAG: hypothetical protein CMJ59_12340 [Planctomycetaceae bacterium]|nr:hypothetical protein [Planctomycetaceae bacterium]